MMTSLGGGVGHHALRPYPATLTGALVFALYFHMVTPDNPTVYITEKECWANAKECRALAERAPTLEHRIMLRHMADTWDRIGRDVSREQTRPSPDLS